MGAANPASPGHQGPEAEELAPHRLEKVIAGGFHQYYVPTYALLQNFASPLSAPP